MTDNLSPSEFACVQALMYFDEYANLKPDTAPVFTHEAFMSRRTERNGGVAPPRGHKDLPCTVYILFAQNKKAIYAGVSVVPFLRWLEHDSNQGSASSEGNYPWDTAVHFNCENGDQARTLERYLHCYANKTKAIVEIAFEYPKGSLSGDDVKVLEAKTSGFYGRVDHYDFAVRTVDEYLTTRQHK